MTIICVNPGCGRPAMIGSVSKAGITRYRVHCSHCQAASYGKHPHRPGVTPYKTGRCTNQDGHLGFACIVDWSKVPAWAKGLTEIDHKDGNPSNHDASNLQELCVYCHKFKGQRSGDYKRKK